MLICHCERVSDREIRACVRAGCRSSDSVGAACGAGTGCGGCVAAIEEVIEDETRPRLTVLVAATAILSPGS